MWFLAEESQALRPPRGLGSLLARHMATERDLEALHVAFRPSRVGRAARAATAARTARSLPMATTPPARTSWAESTAAESRADSRPLAPDPPLPSGSPPPASRGVVATATGESESLGRPRLLLGGDTCPCSRLAIPRQALQAWCERQSHVSVGTSSAGSSNHSCPRAYVQRHCLQTNGLQRPYLR